MNHTYNPELLLPVGNMEMCQAAVHNGADAIYVGVPGFNARGRTIDHDIDSLREIIDFCHLYGVKVNLAFNILIFENELERAIEVLKKIIPLRPDAFIVQDLGLVKIIKEICPEQVVHASTQMTITNGDAIDFVKDLDIKRFVLGRENSLKDIKEIKSSTDKELEVFVHGALCVAYSGQCFTSESIGGRSANRGQCAQSCRFEYEMIIDGVPKDLVDQKYLVSPQDLCGINEIDELMKLGVESFKVEGRLKAPSFVATAARAYKNAITKNYKNNSLKDDINKMAISYSRGFFSGWLHGVDHQQLVDGTFSSNRGLKIGQVFKVNKNSVVIGSDVTLEKGDGLLFARFENGLKKEFGSKVYEIKKVDESKIEIFLAKEFNLKNLKYKDDIYLNYSSALDKEAHRSYSSRDFWKRIALSMTLDATIGKALSLTVSDGNNIVTISSDYITEEAKKELQIDLVKKTLTGLSQTAYECHEFKILTLDKHPFLPNSTLKDLKQKAIEALNAKRTEYGRELNEVTLKRESFNTPRAENPKLTILLREPHQVDTVKNYFIQNPETLISLEAVILDFEFAKYFADAIASLRDLPITIGVATTRILKPKEYYNLKTLINLNPDFILARNLGSVQYLHESAPHIKIHGDFSLNVANSVTAGYLLNKGIERLVPSYDLNSVQLFELLNNTDTSKVEITIHQYMPSFHMEHCVFAAFLSEGSSFKDCGRPCEKHKMELKDQFGNSHYIKVDTECRNTMFNAKSQSSNELLEEMLEKGISHYRFEALHEEGEELSKKINAYIKFFQKKLDKEGLNHSVGSLEKYGLSSGQILKNDQYKDRKQK